MVLNPTDARGPSPRSLLLAILLTCSAPAHVAHSRSLPPGTTGHAPVVVTQPQDPEPAEPARPSPMEATAADPRTGSAATSFDPTCLRPRANELTLWYAIALARARSGDLPGALASMQELQSRCQDEELGEHIARDLDRIEAFLRHRTMHLEELAASGGRLRLELDGRELEFNVESLQDGRIVFKVSRDGIASVLVSELDSYQIATQMSRDLGGPSERWVRVYGYVLGGDERWSALLRRDCKGLPQADLLREDAEAWYPKVRRLGQAGALMDSLAASGGTDASAALEATIERLRTLLQQYGDLEIVQDRRADLRTLAETLLAGSYRPEDALEQLTAAYELLQGGAIRLTYEWKDAQELGDFECVPGYPPERIAVLPALAKDPTAPTHELSDGALVVAGSACWRHIMDFEGPIRLRLRMRVGEAPKEGCPSCFWMLGACDDGLESYVALQELGTAMAVDRASSFVAYAGVEAATQLGPDLYELELECDGAHVRTKVNGELVKEVESGGRARGKVFLVVHSDAPVYIERLEIEGTCSEQSRYQAWLTKQLASIGLGTGSAGAAQQAEDGSRSSQE